MKRLILPLLALLPVVFSCDKKDPDHFENPSFAPHACKLVLKESTVAKSADAVPGAIASIELTESGLYVVGSIAADGQNLEYLSGTYSVNGNQYILNGFGSLEFDNSKEGEVSLSLKRNGETQTLQAIFSKAADSNQLYRTWTIDKTRVTIFGWTVASADFEGCNFYEIAKFVRDSGHKAPTDLKPGYGVQSLTFTGNSSAFFVYTDNTLHMGEFSLNGNDISYRWDNDTMGFTFHTEKASVEYMDGKCILTIDVKILNSTTSGSVTFVLSPL